MPIRDWTRVDAGIFHDFHHEWTSTIRRALNGGVLPRDYYALAEQQTAGFGPDILTLQSHSPVVRAEPYLGPGRPDAGGVLLAPPKVRFSAESSPEFFRRKTSTICVRHVSGDHLVAIVEVISPGNKRGRAALDALIRKACEFLEHGIHLLILDVLPPTKRVPGGIHAALWEEIADEQFALPPDQPLTMAAYESADTVKAYVETVAVGLALPDMPLFLDRGAHVLVPLDQTYQAAYDGVPARWQEVLDS